MIADQSQLVSVIIPSYNHAFFLERALQSVFGQTYFNWEVIVVDNHSSDNTDEIMAKYNDSRIIYLKIHNNGVIAASRNAGLRMAKGTWIAFLDADDWWTSDKLEKSIIALGTGYDIVYHDLMICGPKKPGNRPRYVKTRILESPAYTDLLDNGNALANSGVVVKKELIESIGGLSENRNLIGAEDFDCWIRLALISARFIRLPKAHGYYWMGSHNVSATNKSAIYLNELRRLYYEKYVDMPFWYIWAIGKAYYGEQKLREACDVLSEIKFRKSGLLYYTKVLAFRMYILIRMLGQRWQWSLE